MAACPIADGELAGLFAGVAGLRRVGLAVSGGPDSTALMHLFARWRAQEPAPDALVLTIDHGLRPEARDEAASVAEAARRLGFACAVLVWQGTKPATGIQDAARDARRRLLAEAAGAHSLDAILTAHTEDDQAETLLMRLARGSGLDGLTGIPEDGMHEGVRFLRPLLGVAKARLIATLEASGIAYIRDPSNADPRFERTRLRQATAVFAELGLTSGSLALSARRLARARQALEVATDELALAAVELDAMGVARLDLDRLADRPEEMALRLVQRLVAAVGGDAAPVSLAKLEALTLWLRGAASGGRTLGRAEIRVAGAGTRRAIFLRELGRTLPAAVSAVGGETVEWDGRFRISLASSAVAVRIVPGLDLPEDIRQALAVEHFSAGTDAAPFILRGTTLVGTPLEPGGGGAQCKFIGETSIFCAGRRSAETQK